VIVVDSSSLVKYLFKEDGWLKVEEELLKDDVYAVDYVAKELLNALWKSVVLHKLLSKEVVVEKWELFKKLVKEGVIVLKNQDEFLDEALSIALHYSITVYDSLCLACAEKMGASLLTSDRRQASAAKQMGIQVMLVE